MAKLLTRCPVCEGQLGVTELTCGHCRTRIQGIFAACRFCRLTPEHLGFVELFLRCEGNLSRVGEEMGISYPTVRNRLAAALTALGFDSGAEPADDHTEAQTPPTEKPPDPIRRREMLEAVARGEMSVEEAAAMLREG
jgi:hypothetical protein